MSHLGWGVPGEGQHPAAGEPALHPDGLLPGQSLQHPDQAAEPAVRAGNRTQSPGGKILDSSVIQPTCLFTSGFLIHVCSRFQCSGHFNQLQRFST